MPARGLETMAAEAEDLGVRHAAPQLRGQRAGIEIAGRLAAGDHDSHRRGPTRYGRDVPPGLTEARRGSFLRVADIRSS